MKSNQLVCARTAIAAGVLLLTVNAHATAVNIDFGSYNGAPSSTFGAASGQTGIWNNVSSLGTTSGLVDTAGNADGVAVSVSAGTMGGAACFSTTDFHRSS